MNRENRLWMERSNFEQRIDFELPKSDPVDGLWTLGDFWICSPTSYPNTPTVSCLYITLFQITNVLVYLYWITFFMDNNNFLVFRIQPIILNHFTVTLTWSLHIWDTNHDVWIYACMQCKNFLLTHS